jgi:hypothetical protein
MKVSSASHSEAIFEGGLETIFIKTSHTQEIARLDGLMISMG